MSVCWETRTSNRSIVPGKRVHFHFLLQRHAVWKYRVIYYTIVNNLVNHKTVDKRCFSTLFHFQRASLFPGEAPGLICPVVLYSTVCGRAACLYLWPPEAQRQESMIHDLSGSFTHFIFSISCCMHAHVFGHVKNHNALQLCVQWLRQFPECIHSNLFTYDHQMSTLGKIWLPFMSAVIKNWTCTAVFYFLPLYPDIQLSSAGGLPKSMPY